MKLKKNERSKGRKKYTIFKLFVDLNISQQLAGQLDKKFKKDIDELNDTINTLTLLIFIKMREKSVLFSFGYLYYK